MIGTLRKRERPEFVFWLLICFLIVVAFTGGASRIDVQSLAILRPFSVAVCAIALLTLRREHLIGRKWIFAGIGALFLLLLSHLLPLPPALWQSFPGRQEIVEVDKLAGLGSVWRPLTLTPMNGWHALAALFAPLAVLLLGVQLNREDLRRLLPCLIMLGGASGIFGLLQIIGSPTGPLYLYDVTNNGAAVGLFANRNHAALLLALMFPLLTVWTLIGDNHDRHEKTRLIAAIFAAVVLFPLILVTGSRSGLLLSVFGIVASIAIAGKRLLGSARTVSLFGLRVHKLILFGCGVIATLALLTLYFSRAESVQRLFGQSLKNENRLDFWTTCVRVFWKYFPVGSGSGSFVEVFQISEPGHLLNSLYLNHAHNDLIEVGITFGVVGLLFVFVALLFYIVRSIGLWLRKDSDNRSVKLARAAGVAIFMVAMASLTDYPLRTPIIACVFAILVLWLAEPGRRPKSAPAMSKIGG